MRPTPAIARRVRDLNLPKRLLSPTTLGGIDTPLDPVPTSSLILPSHARTIPAHIAPLSLSLGRDACRFSHDAQAVAAFTKREEGSSPTPLPRPVVLPKPLTVPPPTAPARTPPRAPIGGDWASIAASGTKNGEGYAAAARATGANAGRFAGSPPAASAAVNAPIGGGLSPHPSLGGNGTFRFGDGVDGGSNGVGGTPAASPSRPNFSFGTGLSPASPAGPGVGVGAPSPLASPLSSRVDFSTGGDGNGSGGGFGGGGVSPSPSKMPPISGLSLGGEGGGGGFAAASGPSLPKGSPPGLGSPGPASAAASSAVGYGLGAGVGAGAGAGAGSSPAAVGAGWGGGLGGGAFGGGGLGLFTGGASIFGGFGGGDVGGGLWSGTSAATEDERLRSPAGASPGGLGGGGGLGAFGSTNGGNYGF